MGIGGGSVPGSTVQNNPRMRRLYLNGMKEGMYVSNEPGFYKSGEFGIRIESDMLIVPARTRFAFGARPWLKFEVTTRVPIEKKLIDTDLLNHDELLWIDSYHASVWADISPYLSSDARALEWLKAATAPVR